MGGGAGEPLRHTSNTAEAQRDGEVFSPADGAAKAGSVRFGVLTLPDAARLSKVGGEQECLYATPATALLDEIQHAHTRVQRTVMVIGGCEHTRAAIKNFRSTVTRRRAEFAMQKDQLTAHTPGSNMTRLKGAETTPDRPSDRRRIVAEQASSRQNHCFRRVRARQQAESSQMARGVTGFSAPQGVE